MKTTKEITNIILDSMAPENDDIYQVHMKNMVSYSGIIFMQFLAETEDDKLNLTANIWCSEEDLEETLDVTQIAEIYVMVKDAHTLTFVPIE